MDKERYINNLKSTDLRPKRLKIKESQPEVLLEEKDKKENISELFIKQGEIEAMDAGPQRDIAMLRLSMIAELDASNLYDRFADLATQESIRKVMLDISHEEKVHAGEFETLLEKFDESYEKAEEEGEKEVEDLVGIE